MSRMRATPCERISSIWIAFGRGIAIGKQRCLGPTVLNSYRLSETRQVYLRYSEHIGRCRIDRNLSKLLPYLLALRVEISASLSADDERETPRV